MSCVTQPLWNCCTQSPNKLGKYLSDVRGRDKAFKFAIATINLSEYIAAEAGASEESLKAMQSTSWGIGYVRDVFGIFNVLAGPVPKIVGTVGKIKDVAGSLSKTESVMHKGDEHADRLEKGLLLTQHTTSFVEGATFISAFALCRPTGAIQKTMQLHQMRMGETPDPAPLGASAKALGNSFGAFMFVNHVSKFIGSIANMVLQGIFYSREKNTFADEANRTFMGFVKKIWGSIVAFIEKALELVVDVSKVFKVSMPPALILSFTFVASGLAIYSLWREI